jgi:hypothetical protein
MANSVALIFNADEGDAVSYPYLLPFAFLLLPFSPAAVNFSSLRLP